MAIKALALPTIKSTEGDLTKVKLTPIKGLANIDQEDHNSPKNSNQTPTGTQTPTSMMMKFKDLHLQLNQLSPFSPKSFGMYTNPEKTKEKEDTQLFDEKILTPSNKWKRRISSIDAANPQDSDFSNAISRFNHKRVSSQLPPISTPKKLPTEVENTQMTSQPRLLVVSTEMDHTRSALDYVNEILKESRTQRNTIVSVYRRKNDERVKSILIKPTRKVKIRTGFNSVQFEPKEQALIRKDSISMKKMPVIEGPTGLKVLDNQLGIRVVKPPRVPSKKSLKSIPMLDAPEPERLSWLKSITSVDDEAIKKFEEDEMKKKMEAKLAMEKTKEGKKKLRNKIRVKCFMWTYCISSYFYKYGKAKNIEREISRLNNAVTSIHSAEAEIEKFMNAVAGKEIKALFNDLSHNYIFVADQVRHTELKIRLMAEALENHLFGIFDKFISQMPKMNPNIMKYFHTVCEDGSYIPSLYFTEYELKRLPFSSEGVLDEPNEWQSKLIIIVIVMVRIFILRILANATKDFQKYLNIGSFIYICVNELVRSNVQLINKHLDEKLQNTRIKISRQHVAHEKIELNSTNKNELIAGFYHKSQLTFVFKQRRSLFDRVRVSITGWVESLYLSIHKSWIENGINEGTIKKGAFMLF